MEQFEESHYLIYHITYKTIGISYVYIRLYCSCIGLLSRLHSMEWIAKDIKHGTDHLHEKIKLLPVNLHNEMLPKQFLLICLHSYHSNNYILQNDPYSCRICFFFFFLFFQTNCRLSQHYETGNTTFQRHKSDFQRTPVGMLRDA